MDERRVADYFLISGVSETVSESLIESKPFIESPPPITEITVIFKSAGEINPSGFTCLEKTTSGHEADLNSGNFKSQNIFICYKRGTDKPPIVDVGICYDGKEYIPDGFELVEKTAFGRCASLSGTSNKTFLIYQRASTKYPFNKPVIVDLAVIFQDKSESPPPAFRVIRKNLNTSVYGLMGQEVLLCYKKTILRPKSICFKPQLISRFPLEDYTNLPLNEDVPLFCLPTGVSVERWPLEVDMTPPQASSFVLTSNLGQKIYGSVLSFYEPFDPTVLNEDQRNRLGLDEKTKSGSNQKFKVYVTKAICLLSRWPFFECFDKFLFFLHQLVFGENFCQLTSSPTAQSISNTRSRVSVEHYVSHFLLDVSFPTPQRPKVLIQLLPGSDEEIQISQPSCNLPLPQTGASFYSLLLTLGVENTMNVLLFSLSEQKILLHTLNPAKLTGIAEAIVAMLFPLQWQFPYVPVCPPSLKVDDEMWSATFPFILGIDARSFEKFNPPEDIICIDLDTRFIFMSESKRFLNLKALPKRAARVLKASLDRIYQDIMKLQQFSQNQNASRKNAFIQAKKKIELQARETFIRFMATILKDFRLYLLPITQAPTIGATNSHSLFDFEEFLKSRDRSYNQFYQWITKTQMFTHYICERSFASDRDSSLSFFDDCEEKLANAARISPERPVNLFDKEDAFNQEGRSVFIPAPELSPTISRKNSTSNDLIDCGQDAVDGCTQSKIKFGPLDATKFHRHPNQPDGKLLLDLEWPEDSNIDANEKFDTNNEYQSNSHKSDSICRRTKKEIDVCHRQAKKSIKSPVLWTKHLLSCCYSIWFAVLPSYLFYLKRTSTIDSKKTDRILRVAYSTILKMKSLQILIDEICFRVLVLLCGKYGQPALAVRVYFEMKKSGILPNTVTYGYYNKSVLESAWPEHSKKATVAWTNLRNVLRGVALFKASTIKRRERRFYSNFMRPKNSLVEPTKDNYIPTHQTVFREFYYPSVVPQEPIVEQPRKNPDQSSMNYSNQNTSADSRLHTLQKSRSMHLGAESSEKLGPRISRIGSLDKAACVLSSNEDNEDFGCDSDEDEELESRNIRPDQSANRLVRSEESERIKSFNKFLDRGKLLELDSKSRLGALLKTIPIIDSKAGIIVKFNELNVYTIRGSTVGKKNGSLKSIDNLENSNQGQTTAPAVYAMNLIKQTESDRKGSSEMMDPENFAGDSQIILKMENVLKDESGGNKTSGLQETESELSHQFASNAPVSKETSNYSGTESSYGESDDFCDSDLDDDDDDDDDYESRGNKRNFKLASLINETNWWSTPNNSSVYRGIKNAASGFVSSIHDIKSSFSNTNTPMKPQSSARKSKMSKEILSQFTNYFSSHKSSDKANDELTSNDSGDLFRLGTTEDTEKPYHELEQTMQRSQMFDEFEEHYESAKRIIDDIQTELLNESNPDFNPDMLSALEINITSCSKCNLCNSLLYDEEIMELWSHNDSNLSINCVYCRKSLVPVLTINVKDNRLFERIKTTTVSNKPSGNSSNSSVTHTNEQQTIQSFSVPYLSPIVLWKELESVNESDNDYCAAQSVFVDNHPIIFWNLLWFFTRIKLPTHLASLCLTAKSILNGRKLIKTNFSGLNISNVLEDKVSVTTLWDNEKLHANNGHPLYKLWSRGEPSRNVELILNDKIHFKHSFLTTIVDLIKANEMTKAMKLILNERLACIAKFSFDQNRHNLYRDLLFLTKVATDGKPKFCLENFEKHYKNSFNALNFDHVALNIFDKHPSTGSLVCRKLFDKLEL